MDIQHDVIEECNKHGGVVHIYVDRNSAEVRELGPEHRIRTLQRSSQEVTIDFPLLVSRETSTSSVPPSLLPWLPSTLCMADTSLVRLPVT